MRYIKSIVLLIVFFPALSLAQYGASIDGDLKYPSDFVQFEYVSDKAIKGGRLTVHDIGSFDKVNPFTLKGSVAYRLEDLVYESLGVSSLDEPFTIYGLIAKDINVADDHKSVVFTLDENARFSDGSPIEVKDVAYTIDTLTGNLVHPFYNSYYKNIEGYEKLGNLKIRVNFIKANREMHLIVAQMKIMPQKQHANFFQEDLQLTDEKCFPVGSGPYIVSNIIPGKSITYKRNPDYWAVSHPTRVGMYNFDEIVVKYYKDQVVALEAFKAGEFEAACREAEACRNVRVRGLMAMGPMTENTEEIRKIFKQLKRMYDTMLDEYHGGENDIDSLSMGMTDDYPIAIEEGSSIVRIGRKIFNR